jgi:acyl-CoA synthetase (AMP-forming)/AMP-acid ligase II
VNYGDLTRRHARRTPRKPAVIDRDRTVSYGELDSRTWALATSLAAAGAGAGERVLLLADNGLIPHEVMIACARIGAVYVPVDFRLTASEVLAVVENCAPKVIIVGARHLALAEAIRADAGPVARWFLIGASSDGYASYDHAVRTPAAVAVPAWQASGDDPFCILYTSGTTGRAKGVRISHAATLHNGLALAKAYGVDADSRFLMSLPYSATGVVNHSGGPTLMMGGTVVFDEVRNFDATRYFATVQRDRVTHSQLVPTMMYRLLDAPNRSEFDLRSLRTIGYGSAPIPAHRVRSLTEAFGMVFVQAYGMTETCSLATILTHEEHDVVGTPREHILASCGRAVGEVDLKILNDAGDEAALGEVGEVVIRAPWLTGGYWRNEAQTSELLRGGWLHTGDLGRLDGEDYLYIVDRKKDTVITGGSKVFCPEVEATIYAMDEVAEVAVIGLPDAEWGERVHAVVVLRPGTEISERKLIDHCSLSLGKYKCPKTVSFVSEIPKTSTGKFAKPALRRQFS